MKLTTNDFAFLALVIVATTMTTAVDARRILDSSSSKGKGSKSKTSKGKNKDPESTMCYFMKIGEESIPLTPRVDDMVTPYKQVYATIYPPPEVTDPEILESLDNLPEWIPSDATSTMLLYEHQGATYLINANRFPEDPDSGADTRLVGQLILSGGGFETTDIEQAPFERTADGTLGTVNPPGAFAQIDLAGTGNFQSDRLKNQAEDSSLIYTFSSSSAGARSMEAIGVKLTLEEDVIGKNEACMNIVQAIPQVFYTTPPAVTGFEYKWILQDSSLTDPAFENSALMYGVIEAMSPITTISDIVERQYFITSLCYGVCPGEPTIVR